MRKLLLVLLLVAVGYYVFSHYPVLDIVLGKLTDAQMKAWVDEQNRQSNGFVERMKASGDAFLNRRYGPPAKAKTATPTPAPPPAPKPPTPEELRARAEADHKRSIEQLFTPKDGATTTASGLVYKKLHVVKDGVRPSSSSAVMVHFSAWTRDGERFESTYPERKGMPTVLHLRRLVPGLREGIMLMRQGEVAKFWIPAELAFGEKPEQLGAPAGQLKVDVALLGVLSR